MFKTAVHGVVAARAARVGFGATLIAGALGLVRGAIDDAPIFGLHAAYWFAIVWAAAVAVALAAWSVTRVRTRVDPDAMATAGMVVPSIGLALMLPLTVQLPVVVGLGDLRDFDGWVLLSLVITGLAHVVLAMLSAVRGSQLVRGAPAMSASTIYGTVVAVSAIPFAILYLIPPILVAITGLAFIPVLRAQAWIADRERTILASTPPLARAIAP